MEWSDLMLIDKPTGITSFDVIRRLRRIYNDSHNGERAPKMGHAGTLDPGASGLMLIGVGAGTKKLNDYLKLDKEYVAEIKFGIATTTGDSDGEVINKKSVSLTEEFKANIKTAVAGLVGTHSLPVSAYSAIKVDGVPMYKRAHAAAKKGEVVPDVPERPMTVYEAELLKADGGDDCVVATVRFFVASGTYIRSLAVELGQRLGYPASLCALRRTKIGEFSIEDAQSLK